MLYAYALAPYDGSVRLTAARVLLMQDKGRTGKGRVGPRRL